MRELKLEDLKSGMKVYDKYSNDTNVIISAYPSGKIRFRDIGYGIDWDATTYFREGRFYEVEE